MACCKRSRSIPPGKAKPHCFINSLNRLTSGANDDSARSSNFQPAVCKRLSARRSGPGERATALAVRSSSDISAAAMARRRCKCSGSLRGAAASPDNVSRKLAGVKKCKPRCERPSRRSRSLSALAWPRVGTIITAGNSCLQQSAATRSHHGAITFSQASREDSASESASGRDCAMVWGFSFFTRVI